MKQDVCQQLKRIHNLINEIKLLLLNSEITGKKPIESEYILKNVKSSEKFKDDINS